jgi:hypothetical protein
LSPHKRASRRRCVRDPCLVIDGEARRLIDKHGYGRRREELEDAEAAWRGGVRA